MRERPAQCVWCRREVVWAVAPLCCDGAACRAQQARADARVRAAQGSPIDLSAPGGADRTALPTSSRTGRVWVPQVPSSVLPVRVLYSEAES
jgi:hypothetical protein